MATLIKETNQLQQSLSEYLKRNQTIGFVPTMGALHNGHLSLIQRAREENDVVVVSIFVNPTQFNESSDLEKYPRTLEADVTLIQDYVDYVFAPEVSAIYPQGYSANYTLDIASLIETMEGPNRPGHFEGVVQVVHRLLEIVQPTRLYMGQKDFQQFTIIAYMIRTLGIATELVVCPIIREKDGLAMSSRNVRLTPEYRQKAVCLSEALQMAKVWYLRGQITSEVIENLLRQYIEGHGLEVEYFNLCDGHTLDLLGSSTANYVVACTAAWAGDVRLIDNTIISVS